MREALFTFIKLHPFYALYWAFTICFITWWGIKAMMAIEDRKSVV